MNFLERYNFIVSDANTAKVVMKSNKNSLEEVVAEASSNPDLKGKVLRYWSEDEGMRLTLLLNK